MERMNDQNIRQAVGGADAEDIPAGWTEKGLKNPMAMHCPEFVANSPDATTHTFYFCQDCVSFTKVSKHVMDRIYCHKYYCTKGI